MVFHLWECMALSFCKMHFHRKVRQRPGATEAMTTMTSVSVRPWMQATPVTLNQFANIKAIYKTTYPWKSHPRSINVIKDNQGEVMSQSPWSDNLLTSSLIYQSLHHLLLYSFYHLHPLCCLHVQSFIEPSRSSTSLDRTIFTYYELHSTLITSA